MTTKPFSIAGSLVPVTFGDPRQPKSLPLDHPKARYPGFLTETKILPKGWVKSLGSLPLACDILFERDVPVTLSDGTVLYVDVFRPVPEAARDTASTPTKLQENDQGQDQDQEQDQVPAILTWSPYGKAGGSGCQLLDDFPFRLGVPAASLSGLQRWEGPDPAYWVQHGYAVVNADARGAGMSGGDVAVMGTREGRDGKEVVDWVGGRTWCSGRVGMSGNSWLATVQWFIAAEKPKHLTCIAPWEGMSDVMSQVLLLGGVPATAIMSFLLGILALNAGANSWENPVAMALKAIDGLKDDEELRKYVEDKRARIEDIDIPAYVVASWGNPLHTYGTFQAFESLQNAPKWLRVHDSFEWPDYYNPDSQTDLHLFFDYHLKDIPNNWPLTPRFRAQIIDTANPYPLTGTLLSAPQYPLPSSHSRPLKLFFSADKQLDTIYPPSGSASFSKATGELVFEHTFSTPTVLCGALEMRLLVSLQGGGAEDADRDADLYVFVEKVTQAGKRGGQLMVPFQRTWQSLFVRAVAAVSDEASALLYKGPYGCVRVSGGSGGQGDDDDGGEQMLEVRPCMQPIGMRFAAGEKLRIRIKGRDERVFRGLDGALELKLEGDVKGRVLGAQEGEVRVHFGGSGSGNGSWVEIATVVGSGF